jgi:hypothetical protein
MGKTSMDQLRVRREEFALPVNAIDRRVVGPQRGLTDYAVDLMAAAAHRATFMTLCSLGASVKWAGEHILGLGRSQTFATKREIDRCGSVTSWMRSEFLRGLKDKKIPPGAETARSDEADCFYAMLAGPYLDSYAWLFMECQRDQTVDMDEIRRRCGVDAVGREIVDYIMYSEAK